MREQARFNTFRSPSTAAGTWSSSITYSWLHFNLPVHEVVPHKCSVLTKIEINTAQREKPKEDNLDYRVLSDANEDNESSFRLILIERFISAVSSNKWKCINTIRAVLTDFSYINLWTCYHRNPQLNYWLTIVRYINWFSLQIRHNCKIYINRSKSCLHIKT